MKVAGFGQGDGGAIHVGAGDGRVELLDPDFNFKNRGKAVFQSAKDTAGDILDQIRRDVHFMRNDLKSLSIVNCIAKRIAGGGQVQVGADAKINDEGITGQPLLWEGAVGGMKAHVL